MDLPMNVLFLSGCGWNDSGGAQRPAQLARQFKRMGFNVFHWSACDKENGWSPDGVRLVGKEWWTDEDWPAEGLVICALPAYADLALRFHRWGWHVLYDLLDDWEEFHRIGYHREDPREGEQKLLEICLGATASAPVLMEHLARAGVKHADLVRNGGPEEPVSNGKEWIRHRAVLSSYLFGPWIDWSAIRRVAAEEDLYAEIIGKHTGENEGSIVHRAPEACFLGEMPHTMAMQVIAGCDAGMIPFQGPLCKAVDPVKYYDYVAAGLWTVHTPELWPLFERPYTIMAAPPEFPDALRESTKGGR
jgi:hypothetical protein